MGAYESACDTCGATFPRANEPSDMGAFYRSTECFMDGLDDE